MNTQTYKNIKESKHTKIKENNKCCHIKEKIKL